MDVKKTASRQWSSRPSPGAVKEAAAAESEGARQKTPREKAGISLPASTSTNTATSDTASEKPPRPPRSRAAAGKRPGKKKPKSRKTPRSSRRLPLFSLFLEVAALVTIGLAATVAALGYAARRFSGLSLTANLLPFAAVILVLIVGCALFLALWFFVRRRLSRWHPFLAAGLALLLVIVCIWVWRQPRFFPIYEQFRVLVGGREEAARRQLAHQIYATYRRIAPHEAEAMLTREKLYDDEITAAADAYQIDPDLLSGLAAVESSFLPRASADGGDGLFQITSVPQAISEAVDRQLAQMPLSPSDADHRRNALLGAATLAYYVRLMDGDVFLGLLAYNIGPKNGGLHSIMEQYGARDFVAIQPYLQYFPRDYPMKVFAWALLFRITRETGGPLPYQEGNNAARIQTIGIPGLGQR